MRKGGKEMDRGDGVGKTERKRERASERWGSEREDTEAVPDRWVNLENIERECSSRVRPASAHPPSSKDYRPIALQPTNAHIQTRA